MLEIRFVPSSDVFQDGAYGVVERIRILRLLVVVLRFGADHQPLRSRLDFLSLDVHNDPYPKNRDDQTKSVELLPLHSNVASHFGVFRQ